MLKKLRITLATLMGITVVLLFLDFTGTLQTYLGWLAKIQFVPAVLALNVGVIVGLIVLTLIFGRIYCSVICPLGILQDVLSQLNRKKNHFFYSKAKSALRYTVLALFIIALVAGVASVFTLLEPYSIFGRIMTSICQPLYELCNNLLASVSVHYDNYTFYSVDVWLKSLPVLIVAIVSLVILTVLAWRGGRTYCNTICPVGTLLGQLSRFSFLKIAINADACKNCNKCAKNCKASCIDISNHRIDYTRCVSCGNCLEQCSFLAMGYGYNTKKGFNVVSRGLKPTRMREERIAHDFEKKQQQTTTSPDASKRAFLMGAVMATGAAVFAQDKKKVDGGFAIIEDKQPAERTTSLVPPGAVSLKHFSQHCTACQLCVSKCPNDVLRPSTDLEHFMQPTMSYERGFCRPECTSCSEVCPNGAIKPISAEDKSAVQIGHAHWVQKNCIVLSDGVPCGNCQRHCPTGAISMEVVEGIKASDGRIVHVPVIDENKCIGCGACEYVCPSRPYSAIYVEGLEVHHSI